MRVIIAGSRTVTDYQVICGAVEKFGADRITEVVSGTCRGPDRLGERWAKEHGVPIKLFPADWDKFGRSAGYIRNRQMAEYADAAVVVWDGVSRGSRNMADEMARFGKECLVYRTDKRSEA